MTNRRIVLVRRPTSMIDEDTTRLEEAPVPSMHGRVVLCGAISQYNQATPPPGPANYTSLVVKRGRMERFIVSDYAARFPEAQAKLFEWAASGRIRTVEHMVDGLEHAPDALNMLFTGANLGKVIVRL